MKIKTLNNQEITCCIQCPHLNMEKADENMPVDAWYCRHPAQELNLGTTLEIAKTNVLFIWCPLPNKTEEI